MALKLKHLLLCCILAVVVLPNAVLANNLTPQEETARFQGSTNCVQQQKFLSVETTDDCNNLPDDDRSACFAFLGRHANDLDAGKDQIRERCVVRIEYEVPNVLVPDGVPAPPDGSFSNVSDLRNFFIDNLFPRVTRLLIWGIGLVGFGMMLYAGIRYYTTFGNETRAEDAKKTVIWTLIGVLVAMMSFALIQAISSLVFE